MATWLRSVWAASGATDEVREPAVRFQRDDGMIDEDDAAIRWSDRATFGLGGEWRSAEPRQWRELRSKPEASDDRAPKHDIWLVKMIDTALDDS
jgi:hypothetical protein